MTDYPFQSDDLSPKALGLPDRSDEVRVDAGPECACWYDGERRIGWAEGDFCQVHPHDGPRSEAEIWDIWGEANQP